MKSIYTQVQEQTLSYKSAYEISIDTLGKLVIPVELPIRDFFVQTQRLMLMGEEFANLLSSDPGFRKSPLASMQEMNQRYFASLEPDTGYQSSLENPDYAVKLYGIPMALTAETVRIPQAEIRNLKGRELVHLRGALVPIVRLRERFLLPARPAPEEAVLVVRIDGAPIGLVVDEFVAGMDVIMKPMAGILNGVPGYAGTAVLGDGRVLLVLNVKEFL